MVDDAVAQHMATVRELSKPGRPLGPNAATSTMQNPAWWFDGEPTPARDRLHRRLLNEARAAAPHVEQQRRAIILAGPPGAGKSTVLSDVLGLHRDQYLVIDTVLSRTRQRAEAPRPPRRSPGVDDLWRS